MTSYQLTFLTPLFSKGIYEDRPEIRSASIRGQLHWWFRALGGIRADEKSIFGGIDQTTTASKIVVRVSNICGETDKCNTLPHKSGGQAGPKVAYKPKTTFELHLLERLGGLSDSHRSAFHNTVKAWLLLGTLGLRSTRAGGSFSWESLTDNALKMPDDLCTWRNCCDALLETAPLKYCISDKPFDSAEKARRIVSDTIGGRDDRNGEDSLSRIHHPLGHIFKGRKTSPLRFRIIPIGNMFHIAAVWDNREGVTGNRTEDLASVIKLLYIKKKDLGTLFQDFH